MYNFGDYVWIRSKIDSIDRKGYFHVSNDSRAGYDFLKDIVLSNIHSDRTITHIAIIIEKSFGLYRMKVRAIDGVNYPYNWQAVDQKDIIRKLTDEEIEEYVRKFKKEH